MKKVSLTMLLVAAIATASAQSSSIEVNNDSGRPPTRNASAGERLIHFTGEESPRSLKTP